MSSFSSTLICRNLNDRVRRALGQVHGPTIHTLHLPFFLIFFLLPFLSAFLDFVVFINRPSKSSRYLISRPDLRISSKLRHNGPHFRSPRCAQRHQQRREGWQAPGPDPTFFQGHHQVPPGHAAPRIHWRVRGGRRPPIRQDRCPAQRPPQQDWCHLSPLQRAPL